jgi:peptidyl-prolyl cis-trans isomerase A (cyclophilin A)
MAGPQPPKTVSFEKGKTVTATFRTTLGSFTAKLFHEQAPMTVGNFAGLAMGEIPWKDPRTGQPKSGALYDGTVFHRVIKNFMIQGGDPLGTGTGGPGYRFGDEIVPGLKHDRPGILSMANAGPNTNGSQFFVTEVPTPWLDGKHTVFGAVVEGLDTVLKIASTPVGPGDRPRTPVVLEQVTISVK